MNTNFEEKPFDKDDEVVEMVEISEILNSDGSLAEEFISQKNKRKSKRGDKRFFININSDSPWYLKLISLILVIPIIILALLFSAGIAIVAILFALISITLVSIINFFIKRKK